MPSLVKIPEKDIPAIIARYRNLESMASIAKDYGCSDEALYKRIRFWCNSGRGDAQYEQLVTDAYVLRNIEAEDELDGAIDPVGVTRAREKVKCTQWHLERRRAKLYGQKAEVSITGPASIALGLDAPVTQHIVDVTPHNSPENVTDWNYEVNPFD